MVIVQYFLYSKGCLLEMRIDNGVVLISKRGSGMEMSLQSFMEVGRLISLSLEVYCF